MLNETVNVPNRFTTLMMATKAKELIEIGMRAVVYCGSMGDWPLLSDEQRKAGVKPWAKRVCQSSLARGPKGLRGHALWLHTRRPLVRMV